ncbi:hypothetical protein [Nonomuraea sp. NPDC050643]|uniref:hypothetical protein n=1 Tax=Nonomuraea sp. NPDC050643 TaxID=3155660 RepID=UPI0033C581AF
MNVIVVGATGPNGVAEMVGVVVGVEVGTGVGVVGVRATAAATCAGVERAAKEAVRKLVRRVRRRKTLVAAGLWTGMKVRAGGVVGFLPAVGWEAQVTRLRRA